MADPTQKQIDIYHEVKDMMSNGVMQKEAYVKLKTSKTTFYKVRDFLGEKPPNNKVNKGGVTEHQQKTYDIINNYLAENKDATVTDALNATNTHSGVYYSVKKIIEGKSPVKKKKIESKPPSKKRKYERKKVQVFDIPVTVEEPVPEKKSKMVVIVCEADELNKVMSNIF